MEEVQDLEFSLGQERATKNKPSRDDNDGTLCTWDGWDLKEAEKETTTS